MSRQDPLAQFSTRTTPQSQPAAPNQVRNDAGGFTFQVTPVEALRRFLTLGVSSGTYYVGAGELTQRNAQVVIDMINAGESIRVVDEAVRVSVGGLAPRQQPALFALALVAGTAPQAGERRYALDQVNAVARTGTTLFQFVRYMEQFRGWGRAARRAIGQWYLRDVGQLAYQAVKYRQRDGWTHRDVLRLSHPKPSPDDLSRRALFDWICGHAVRLELSGLPENDPLLVVEGYERVRHADAREVPGLIREYRLPWEALPDAAVNEPAVWEALLENGLPQTALIRQLPRLTRIGLLSNTNALTQRVAQQLTSVERLQRGRVHPMNVLVAQRTYASGRSERGSSSWTPVRRIVDALDAAFYAAYGAVEPTGKRTMLALDVSGSMGSRIGGMPLSCREASAAIALVTANVEDRYELVGFTAASGRTPRTMAELRNGGTALTPLSISPRQRLNDAVDEITELPFGRTDCALPMLHAIQNNIEIDTFVIYTDNETWHGDVHPHQALRRYREQSGIAARLVVVGMTATPFTIADPTDAGMLDVAGFDTSVPSVISQFARGAE